jgi:hypothetical protein
MPQLLWYWLYPLTMLTLGLLLIWQALPVSGAVAMLLSLAWLIGMLALWSHLRRQSSTSGAIEVILLGGPGAHSLQRSKAGAAHCNRLGTGWIGHNNWRPGTAAAFGYAVWCWSSMPMKPMPHRLPTPDWPTGITPGNWPKGNKATRCRVQC